MPPFLPSFFFGLGQVTPDYHTDLRFQNIAMEEVTFSRKHLRFLQNILHIVDTSSPSLDFLRLCLVPRKFEGKCKGKKIQRKSRGKEKVKENKKID